MFSSKKYSVLFFLATLAVLLIISTTGFAADLLPKTSEARDLIDFGAKVNSTEFDEKLTDIYDGMQEVGKIIATILTVAAGLMVAFGIEDGKQLVWKWILGIGLAVNFGYALMEIFGPDIAPAVPTGKEANEMAEAYNAFVTGGENKHNDMLSQFMAYFSNLVIVQGGPPMQAIAIRMTLVLAAIDSFYRLAMDLISGDKIKYMLTVTIKAGFFIFLEKEWFNLLPALMHFFEQVGYLAGGADEIFSPDSIWLNFKVMLSAVFGVDNKDYSAWQSLLSAAGFSAATGAAGVVTGLLVGGPAGGIVGMIGPVICAAIVILIFGMGVYIAVEILMVRIEFYMMMLLSLIMLPFAMVDKLSFLSNQAISGVFNSGTKLMVICFLQATITKLLIGYMHTINLQGLIDSISTILQLFVACCLFTYMVKKLPELAAGLLQGNGGMTGQGMLDQTVKIMKTTAMAIGVAGGAVAGGAAMGAGGAAGGAGAMGKGQMAMSAMKNIAQTGAAHVVGNSSLMQGFAKGANAVMGTGSKEMPKGFADRVGRLLAGQGSHSGNLFQDLENTKSGQRAKDSTSNNKKDGSGGGGKEKETQTILREMVRNSNKDQLRATFSSMERDALRTAMNTMDKDSRHQVFQAMKEASREDKKSFVEKIRGGGGSSGGSSGGGGSMSGVGQNSDRKKNKDNR